MALPAEFPPPPKPPTATEPLDTKSWRDYHTALNRWLAQLVAALKV